MVRTKILATDRRPVNDIQCNAGKQLYCVHIPKVNSNPGEMKSLARSPTIVGQIRLNYIRAYRLFLCLCLCIVCTNKIGAPIISQQLCLVNINFRIVQG
jgi:hypothetical protein